MLSVEPGGFDLLQLLVRGHFLGYGFLGGGC